MDAQREGRLDAAGVLFEIGRRVQAAAVAMWKHRLVPSQQICTCGRMCVRTLPTFGLRCDVACDDWDTAMSAMERLLSRTYEQPDAWLLRGSGGSAPSEAPIARGTARVHQSDATAPPD